MSNLLQERPFGEKQAERDYVREGVVRTGRTSSTLGCQPDPTRRSHPPREAGDPRDHVREGVVQTGRTSSNLGRQPDPRRPGDRTHVRGWSAEAAFEPRPHRRGQQIGLPTSSVSPIHPEDGCRLWSPMKDGSLAIEARLAGLRSKRYADSEIE